MGSVREEIAKNLLYYRKKAGYTQKQFAEMLGVKNSSVSNWENGLNSIDIETLYAACNIFGITLNDMYGMYSNDNAKNVYTSHQRKVIDAYSSHPEMQPAVDKLLGIEEGQTVADDMSDTIKQCSKAFSKNIVVK